MRKPSAKRRIFASWKLVLPLVILFVLPAGPDLGTDATGMTQESKVPFFNLGKGTAHKVYAPAGVLRQGAGVAVWHDYGSYALYRITDAALARLSPAERAQVTIADEANLVIGTREHSVQSLRSEALNTMEPAVVTGPALQLVQFVGPIKEEWLAAVDAVGAKPIHYIATNGYLLWADATARAELDRMVQDGDFLDFSAPYPQDLKMGPAIAQRMDPDEVVQVVIQMYRHAGSGASEAAIQDMAVSQLSSWTPILNFQNIYVEIRMGNIADIIALYDVFWVEERMERHLLDEVQGQILAGNLSGDQSGPSAPGYLTWLDGYGFSTDPADYPIVDVTDDGIGNGTVNSGDPTLHQFGNLANPTRLAYVANCTNSASGEGVDGHGHINTSIAGSYDLRAGFPFQDPLGYQRGLGINPYGRMAGTRVFDPGFDQSSCGGSDTGVIKSIQDNGALINSNSWGCGSCAGSYDEGSQAYDVGVRDADLTEAGNQEMIIVFSAGNYGPSSGTVGTPGNGKNMITVGASENQRPSDEDGNWTDGCGWGPTAADDAMDVISFSSRGPSPGSRVKPEVIAPGTHIQGTASTNAGYTGNSVCDQYRPSGQTVFAASTGTSHSAPAVAGVTSLAYYWMENTYAVTPSPALMKAYLIAHPTYLTGVSANDTLPSNSQGYGMPNMTAMFDDASKYLLNQEVTFDNSGETWTWEGAVADPTKPVRIVLAYTDAAGAIGTSPQVNDLNLAAMVDVDTYLGNVFSGQWSITGGAADPFNNYESIFLPVGTDGSIEITVTGFNIAGDGVPNTGDGTDQDFALVCYNCAETPGFTLSVTPTSAVACTPSDGVFTVDVGSILGYTDPVTLSASGNPAGTTATFSANPVIPPGSSTLTIGNTGAAVAGSYSIDVTGTSTAGVKSRSVDLNLFTAVPVSPTLLAPPDGAIDVSFKPTFSWTAVAQASSYLLEVATDPGFTNIVYNANETGTSHTAAVPLSANTTYYWRVTAGNVCGTGTSIPFSFTTQAATMVCNGATVDFEDGIPVDWTVVNNSPGGIIWTTTADPACEQPNRTNGTGEAACADSDAAGLPAVPYDTELVSNPFDLSAYGGAVLDVKAYYNDILDNGNDRFEVDVWDGVSWVNELTWDEDHVPEDFTLNLSAYAGLPIVQVRFRYSGNGYDWYAQADDIALTCVPVGPPAIEVDPAALVAEQGPDIISTQPIEIRNTGGSPLNWNIVEDDTACDSPVDIPWLSVSPDAGATYPLDSTVVDVSIDSGGLTPGVYTANLCVNSDDPVTPLLQVPVTLTVLGPVLLLCNGDMIQFEAGIPSGWQVVDNTGGTGIVWTTTADPACEIPNRTNGSGEAACADSDAGGYPAVPYDTELWSPLIDLSGQGAALLDVKAYYRDITTNGNDRFEVDVWDGFTWTTELSWDEDHEPEDFRLNLSAYAGLAGARIRFRYFGNGYDYYAQVDDVALTCVPIGPPAIEVDPGALSVEQGPDIFSTHPLEITNTGGSPLNWNIAEDDTACDSPVDIPWLSVSPDAGATLPLDSTIVDVTLDSAGLAPGVYTANLCVDSDDPVTPLLQVPVTLTVLPPVSLVCNGAMIDFEEGIPLGWQVVDNTGGTGIVWTTTADPACEQPNRTNGTGEAACADSDAAGYPAVPYDTELWSYLIDLSGQGAVVLDVKAYYNDYNVGSNDRFEVDVWDGVAWTNELTWDEDHMPEDFSLNLSAYAGLTGVRIRFRYSGNGYDWYAQVDDIALTCAAIGPPIIGVDPASLAAEQGPDLQSTQPLTITNSGGSLLNWSIVEDDTACDSPTDIPWLSVSPSSGATIPLDSSVVDVTFDSTGLTPGDYTANLCVNSDDPTAPIVPVPVTLTVLPPFTLVCNGEVADFETGLPSGWQVIDNEGFGVVWTTIAGSGETGNYTGGAGDAATASSDRAGAAPFDTVLRTTSFDLSGWLPTDEIYLDYLANYQNYAAYDYLDLDISTDGGATWTNLLSWNEDHGSFRGTPGEAVTIDLSPYAGMSGLQLRWHYYDPTPGNDYDWYAQIDEAGLSCIPSPLIDVSPTSFSSSQVPSEAVTQILTLSNLGGADLIWNIDEAPAPASPVPAAVPMVTTSSVGAPIEADRAKLEEDRMVLGASSDQSLSVSPDWAPTTVPFSSRDVVSPFGALVNDGSFENGPPPASAWTETTNNACEWIDDWADVWGAAAYDGVYDFWGGGYCSGNPSTDSVEQAITVPYGGSLSFWYMAYRVDPDDAAVDTAYISVDGSVVWSLDLSQANNTFPNWVNANVDLSAYVGQTVNLKFGADSFGDQTGNIRFDFIEFGTVCDLPSDVSWLSVSPDAGTTIPGGSTAVDVTTDATGLVPALYEANLCVNSNDPITSQIEVPVEMTVNNVPPEATVDPGTQDAQYSDQIAPVSITAVDNIAEVLTAATSWSADGGPFNPGLPDFLVLSAPSCVDSGGGMQTCTWTVSGPIDLPEGVYTVRATVSDDFGGVAVVDSVINVLPENAQVNFDDDNAVAVPVADPGGDSGPFSLTFYVVEKEPDLPADPGGSGAAGDISRANVASVILVPVGPGSPMSPVSCTTSVAPVGYAGEMTVVCGFDGVPVNTYSVQVLVDGGYYVGDGEDVLVVYDPSLGFTTGGGWFYWPGTTDKTNFGYTMKYNKRGSKIQGSLLLIRHLSDGSKYRLKSNALYGLALGDEGTWGWATFSGKTTYLEPGMPEPIGNYEFLVYVEDHNEPGHGVDAFWLQTKDKDLMVVPALSMMPPPMDYVVPLGGGNIVVPHGSGAPELITPKR